MVEHNSSFPGLNASKKPKWGTSTYFKNHIKTNLIEGLIVLIFTQMIKTNWKELKKSIIPTYIASNIYLTKNLLTGYISQST